MAKPFAKLLSMLTPKRRWAQFSLATMFVVVTALSGVSSSSVRRSWAGFADRVELELEHAQCHG
jgi:hypothetical protein